MDELRERNRGMVDFRMLIMSKTSPQSAREEAHPLPPSSILPYISIDNTSFVVSSSKRQKLLEFPTQCSNCHKEGHVLADCVYPYSKRYGDIFDILNQDHPVNIMKGWQYEPDAQRPVERDTNIEFDKIPRIAGEIPGSFLHFKTLSRLSTRLSPNPISSPTDPEERFLLRLMESFTLPNLRPTWPTRWRLTSAFSDQPCRRPPNTGTSSCERPGLPGRRTSTSKANT
ncbi:hypothetical protein F5Y06DRAFT_296665 [Hypoxylon sp. FL0890]|nr:hypothetical protein F5Y06DRAFT_296665 [Hypoxylon sp. FL0890]